ncbi:MAG: hypothetical protein CME30_01445 [Gemmatimonadetes bacterium]|nr:hypothetical protein [Gemmatimonadota bacterium]
METPRKKKKIWRAVFHAISGTILVGAILVFDLDRTIYLGIVSSVFCLLLFFDLLRLRYTNINQFFLEGFRLLVTARESRSIASSTWFTLGSLIALTFFAKPAALSAILVHSWADPVAAYIGTKWGKLPFLGGSLEGIVAFVFIAFLALNIHHSPQVAFYSACLCSFTERLAWPIDDNLLVPPICAGIITTLTLFL